MDLEQVDKDVLLTIKEPQHKNINTEQRNKLLQLLILGGRITTESIKQLGQRTYEHIPYVQVIDAYRQEGLVSRTPIPKGSPGYYGRIASVIPQSGIVSEAIINGREILNEANVNLLHVLQGESLPQNISTDMWIVMLSIASGLVIYYTTTKVGDAIQIKNKIVTTS